MGHHDELIDRLTHRLRVDPDLRADVEAELRTHLEDSEADFRAAGDDEATAAANAARALGDESDLAEQLWQANRRRIRLRRVCKWAARVALIPGAILTVLLVASGPWDTLRVSTLPIWAFGPEEEQLTSRIDAMVLDRIGKQLTEDELLVLRGDRNGGNWPQRVKGLADRWPDNDNYRANYICSLLTQERHNLPEVEFPAKQEAEGMADVNLPPYDHEDNPLLMGRPPAAPTKARKALTSLLAELDAAEQACPANALYNYAKAGVLMQASAADNYYSGDWDPESDEPPTRPYVHIANQEMFDLALAELAKGESKPLFTSHLKAISTEQVAILSQSDRFAERTILPSFLACQFLRIGHLGTMRDLARVTLSRALESAENGDIEHAWQLNRQIETLATKMGEGAPTLIDLLTAKAIHKLARGNRADIHRALGREDLANILEAANDRKQEEFVARRRAHEKLQGIQRRRASFIANLFTSDRLAYDPEPIRSAEHVIAEQVGLAALLTLVSLAALVAGGMYGLSVLFRRSRGTRLLFVGWGQLGRICLFAVVIPLGLAAIYTHWLPISNRQYGLWFIAERVTVEFAAAIAIIMGLLWGLTYSAIRKRAKEAGLTTPPPLRWRNRSILSIMATLLGACAIFFIATDDGPEIENNVFWMGSNFEYDYLGFVLAGVITLFMLAWAIRELVFVFRLRSDYFAFKRTLIRSSVGVLAAAVIVIGLFCGLALQHAEATAVGQITGTAQPGIHNEVELSSFRFIRDDLRARHAELMAEIGQSPGKAVGNARP